MSKIKVGLFFIFFLLFSPLLLILGQNYRFWGLSKFTRLIEVNINEKTLLLFFYPIFIIFMPIGFIIVQLEKVLKYQYPIITFIFTIIATLLYCFLLSNIILIVLLVLKKFISKKNRSK